MVGNSPGVRRKLAEGIESLPEWRKGVHQKKTKTRRKIIGGSRKACWGRRVNCLYSGFQAVEPPMSAGEPLLINSGDVGVPQGGLGSGRSLVSAKLL
ncbi:hypothetical protein GW17_00016675 [Ensete ventricosum]|nr:hypothetical protein GW17_00016675 [Ensete ventricosum]